MMNRRRFIAAAAMAPALISQATAARPSGDERDSRPAMPLDRLKRWRDLTRAELFDSFLPFLDRYVIDKEYGGFMCDTAPDGAHLTTDKTTRYQARGVWVYSFLHNNFEKRDEYLKIARGALNLLLNYKRPSMDRYLPEVFDRKGTPTLPDSNDIFGDLFLAEGMQEYARATNDDKILKQAKDLLFNCVRLYDKPDFMPEITSAFYSRPGEPPANWAFNNRPVEPLKGARFEGIWFTMLRVATQMLEHKPDPDVSKLADRCVDAIMVHHFNPRFRLTNEFINHDLSRPTNEYEGQVYLGHAIETQWMVLYEALRRRDKKLFQLAAERFRRHVTVATDDVYGGVVRNLANVDKNELSLDKVQWEQAEVIIGSLCLAEHLDDPWGLATYSEFFDYDRANFSLRSQGVDSPYHLALSESRVVKYDPKAKPRVENYHYPRQLMLTLLALDRMIGRKGRISTFMA